MRTHEWKVGRVVVTMNGCDIDTRQAARHKAKSLKRGDMEHEKVKRIWGRGKGTSKVKR